MNYILEKPENEVIGMVEIRVLSSKPAGHFAAFPEPFDEEYLTLSETFGKEFDISKFVSALAKVTGYRYRVRPRMSYVGEEPLIEWYLLVDGVPVIVQLDNDFMELKPLMPENLPLNTRKEVLKKLIAELEKAWYR
ncbi:MAG: hypothetical protein ACTSXW_08425 [Candidatus Baldrarchaeia archaeon]